MTDLKTVLVDALNKSLATEEDYAEYRTDPLAVKCGVQAHDVAHLIVITNNGPDIEGDYHTVVPGEDFYEIAFNADRLATAVRDHFKNQRFEIFETVNQAVRGEITPERAADMIRLAYLTVLNEGLAGGSEG